MFTGRHTLENSEKGATLSHFASSAKRASGYRAIYASRFAIVISDISHPFAALPKSRGTTCTKRARVIRPLFTADSPEANQSKRADKEVWKTRIRTSGVLNSLRI
jgi:hypothetical protein